METKTLPHDIELEQSILAGLILFADMRDESLTQLIELDFYQTRHQKIFKAVKYLEARGIEIDLVSVVRVLKEKKMEKLTGGGSYLAEISDTAPVPSNVKVFCEKLKNISRLRNIITICNNTQNQCYDPANDSIELINNFQTVALNLDDEITPDFTTKAELTTQSIDRYLDAKNGIQTRAIKTGYFLFDKYLGGGFRGALLVLIAARPGVGKTALMCNMVERMCGAGVFCGVFSLEMEKEELDDRWLAGGADVNSMELLNSNLDDDGWSRVMDSADKQSRWNLLIDDQGNISIDELKRRCRRMKKQGVQVIFIDQLSKISGNRKKSVFERNTEHVEELGFLKKELGIPVVLLAQLNRELEKRSTKKPILSDLKNTGQLEEEANIVFLGYRKFIHTRDENDRNHAEWEIAKNRQGATTNIKMFFNDKRMRFEEISNQKGI